MQVNVSNELLALFTGMRLRSFTVAKTARCRIASLKETSMESTDKIVAATLASGLIVAGAMRNGDSTGAQFAAMLYFDRLEALRHERTHRRQLFVEANGGAPQHGA